MSTSKKSTVEIKTVQTPVINIEKTTVDLAPVVIVDESDKLIQLRADKKSAYVNMTSLEFDTKPWMEAQMDVYKFQKLIDAELAEISKAKQKLDLDEKRNARIQLRINYLDSVTNQLNFEFNANKDAANYIEVSNLFNDEVKRTAEILDNELLARYATSTPSKSIATGKTTTGTKGATGAEIVELFKAGREAGTTDTEITKSIIASGYSRGTTGAVVLAYQREIGEKS